MSNWIHSAKEVVAGKQFHRIDTNSGHLVPSGRNRRGKTVIFDLTTASMLLSVYDALNEKNKEKFSNLTLLSAVNVGWKLISKK